MTQPYPQFDKLPRTKQFCGIDIESTAIDPITKDIEKIWSVSWDFDGVPRSLFWREGITKADLYRDFTECETRAVITNRTQYYELVLSLKEILLGETEYTPCFHSAQFDAKHLQECMEETLAPFICTQQLAYVVFPPAVMGCEGDDQAMRHYKLESLARKGYCDAKLDYDGGWDTFSEEMLEYNKQDATSCRQLAQHLFPILLGNSNLWNVFLIDMTSVWMCAQMTHVGCRVDADSLTSFHLQVEEELEKTKEELRRLCPAVATKEVKLKNEPKRKIPLSKDGIYNVKDIGSYIVVGREGYEIICRKVESFDPGCAEHLLVYLKLHCGFIPKKFSWKTKKPVLDKGVIGELAEAFYPASLIQDYRQKSKLLSTYLKPFQKSDSAGRIHPNFITCNTRTGRLSSSNPNFQNIPRGKCRELVVAPPGKKLVCVDLSQVELRILAWYMAMLLKDTEPTATFMWEQFAAGADIHGANARLLNVERKLVKVGIFLYIYGGSEKRMASSLGLSLPAAKSFMDSLEGQLPALPAMRRLVHRMALEEKFMYTLYGRQIYYPNLHDDDAPRGKKLEALRQYFNAVIQGGQADLMKIIMWQCRKLMNRYGALMLIQVHDELVFEVGESNAALFADALLPVFNNTYLLRGLVVRGTPGIGDTWAEAKLDGEKREKESKS